MLLLLWCVACAQNDLIDEQEKLLSDDDGDGFSDLDGDCDDTTAGSIRTG